LGLGLPLLRFKVWGFRYWLVGGVGVVPLLQGKDKGENAETYAEEKYSIQNQKSKIENGY